MGVERTIEYEVEAFKINTVNLHETLDFQADLICMDPMFWDVLETGETIATWVRGWKWKFTLPFKMKERGEPQKEYHQYRPCRDTSGDLFPRNRQSIRRFPIFLTGERHPDQAGIDHGRCAVYQHIVRKEEVEIVRNDTRMDAFDYIDLDSQFFSLQVGDNVIEYTSENGLDPQNVEIRYRNRYIGV